MRSLSIFITVLCSLSSCGTSTASDPLDSQLTAGQRAEIQSIKEGASFTRILHRNFSSTMATYDFLLDRLGFLGVCMRELKIRPYLIKPRGDGSFDFDDMRGIQGVMRQWAQGEGRRLYRASVTGRGPLGITVEAEVLMILQYSPHAAPGTIQNSLEVFVNLGGFAGAMAPLILPMAGKAFDKRIDSVLGGARDLSEFISKDPTLFLFHVEKSQKITKEEARHLRCFLEEQGKLSLENPGGP